MSNLIIILNWTWGIIQTLAGAILRAHYKRRGQIAAEHTDTGHCKTVHVPSFKGGVSLGHYTFVSDLCEEDVLHEAGHSKQSALLGVFYLIVVGIPSLINYIRASRGKNAASRRVGHADADYYKQYPENWADKLGGVKR